MDLDEEVYARIKAHTDSIRKLESHYPPRAPRELIMSIETVREQRKKVEEIAARLRSRLKEAVGPTS